MSVDEGSGVERQWSRMRSDDSTWSLQYLGVVWVGSWGVYSGTRTLPAGIEQRRTRIEVFGNTMALWREFAHDIMEAF